MSEQTVEALSDPRVRFEPMTAAAASMLGPAIAGIDPWARYGYSAEALATYLSASESDAIRREIVLDRSLAGAIVVRRNWLRGPYLQFLAILPSFQGHGLGRAALAWFESGARAEQAQNIWVAASDFNARALAFYERSGFKRVASLDGLVADGNAEILLRKRLSAT